MASLRLLVAGLLAQAASAMLVTHGSSCQTSCGNNLDTTADDEMICSTADLSSPAGTVFKNCITCEVSSPYTNSEASPVTSDLQSLLYNLRATISKCLYKAPTNPCLTSRACEPLKDAVHFDDLAPNATAYGYCSIWSDEFEARCGECLLELPDGVALNNYFQILTGACDLISQSPSTIPFDGDVFSTTTGINITEPTPTATVAPPPTVGSLQYGQVAGVVVGAVVLLLVAAGCGVVCNGKRRRRAYLRRRSQHLGAVNTNKAGGGASNSNWPGTPMRHEAPGRDLFDTPVSQRPLRGHGWADSPISAATSDGNFPHRYFSPYSSTYNSPVSAAGSPHNMPWPVLAADGSAPAPSSSSSPPQQQQPNIGVAFSSSEGDYSGSREDRDAYEMQGLGPGPGPEGHHGYYAGEPSSGAARRAAAAATPVLSHPGYGRSGSSSSSKGSR